MKILFATGRFPYPPLRGDRLVPYFRMKYLAQRHEITLLSFIEKGEDLECTSELKRCCAEVYTVHLPRWRSYLHVAAHAIRPLPLQTLYYHSSEYKRRLQEILGRGRFDIVHTILARMAAHTMNLRGVVKICDMIDALSLTMQRRADAHRGPYHWLLSEEAARMRRFERQICRSFDSVVVVSDVDREHLGAPNVTVVPAGADVEQRPRRSLDGRKTVIFTGNFDYYPNRDAALFLLREIWPAVRRAIPSARLKIVGNNPRRDLLRVASGFPEVEVTGFVPDLSEYLLEADVAVSPVRLGGAGMHRKVIEAMSCGTPVVVSPLVSGFQARAGEELLVAETVPEYVRAIRAVFENYDLAKRLSENGKRLVKEKYSWEGTTRQLETVYRRLLGNKVETTAPHADRN